MGSYPSSSINPSPVFTQVTVKKGQKDTLTGVGGRVVEVKMFRASEKG